MTTYGIYPTDGFNIGDSLMVAVIAIVIVFFVLSIIIFVTYLFAVAEHAIDVRTKINARPENAILDEDKDAVVAALVASIDYHKETGKNARIVSITKIEG